MNDLISRQAAIDAIVNTVSKIKLHDNSEVARYGATFRQHEIIDIIECVPSAQPEIIRCKDCKHRIYNKHIGEKGYLQYKAYCELDTGNPFDLGRDAHKDDWFCADAERTVSRNEDR